MKECELKTVEMSHRGFMEQVGYLSYAVVAIDGVPDVREVRRVQKHISGKVRAVEGFETVADDAEWLIALIAFEEADRRSMKPSAILKAFEDFAKGPVFRRTDAVLRKEGMELLRYAAGSLNGTGKAESTLLKVLETYF